MSYGVAARVKALGARIGISVLMPLTALASTGITALAGGTPTDLMVGGQWIDTEDGQDHEITFDRGSAKYVAATNTLVLTDATIPVSYVDRTRAYSAIYSDMDINVELVGDIIINSDEENTWAIYSDDNMTITGDSLTITSDTICIYDAHTLEVDGVTMNLTATGDTLYGEEVGYAIFARTGLDIKNGSDITADAQHYAFFGGRGIDIDDSTVKVSSRDGGSALHSDEYITINDSAVTATTVGEDGQDNSGIWAWDDILITDSTVTASSDSEDGIYSDVGEIIITNSTVNATGEEDGIYGSEGVTIQYHSDVTATGKTGVGIDAATEDWGGEMIGGVLKIEESTVTATGADAGLHSDRDTIIDSKSVVSAEGDQAILIEQDPSGVLGGELKITQPDGTTQTYAPDAEILQEKALYVKDGKLSKDKPVTPTRKSSSKKEEVSSGWTCNHSYEWETYKAATATTDGIMRYRCKYCGKVEYEVPTAAYYVFNKETQESIQKAAANATVTINTPIFISFHEMVKDALVARPDVTLVVDYKNAGKNYEMTIPAGSGEQLDTLYGESKYAGFLYLGGAFATVEK